MINDYMRIYSEQWSNFFKNPSSGVGQGLWGEMPDWQKWQDACRQQAESCQKIASVVQDTMQQLTKDRWEAIQQTNQRHQECVKHYASGQTESEPWINCCRDHAETWLNCSANDMNQLNHMSQTIVSMLRKNLTQCMEHVDTCTPSKKKKAAA